MTPEEQIDQLKKRVSDLEYKLSLFVKPDGYSFQKTLTSAKGIKLGFYGQPAVSQPSSTGVTDHAINGGATVSASDSFSDGAGGTYYTISDIVKHLKSLGILGK